MVTDMQRHLIQKLVELGKVRVLMSLMRVVSVEATNPGAAATLERIRKAQKVDDWHHAPCCPANHWCRTRLVFQSCNCGAERHKVK